MSIESHHSTFQYEFLFNAAYQLYYFRTVTYSYQPDGPDLHEPSDGWTVPPIVREAHMVTVKALLDAGVPLSFIASAGTACLVEGEDEKIKIIQSPTWDELDSSIASVQAVFNKRLVQTRMLRPVR